MTEYMLGLSGQEKKLSSCDCTMQESATWLGREVRTADGSLKRDMIALKRQFTFNYAWLPAERQYVFDGGMGRNELYALYASGLELSLLVGTEQVDVHFAMDSWRERLILEDCWWGKVYEVSFTLVEV